MKITSVKEHAVTGLNARLSVVDIIVLTNKVESIFKKLKQLHEEKEKDVIYSDFDLLKLLVRGDAETVKDLLDLVYFASKFAREELSLGEAEESMFNPAVTGEEILNTQKHASIHHVE